MYMNLDADYYADEEDFTEDSSIPDYSGNYTESYNERTNTGSNIQTVMSSQNWLVYGILGGTMAGFMMLVVWRKRVSLILLIRTVPEQQSYSRVLLRRSPSTTKILELNWSPTVKISMEPLLAITQTHKLPWYSGRESL